MSSVLFLFFNRPGTAAKVFSEIRAAKPAKLFLAADGPRNTVAGDVELCQKTRASVEGLIDWPCEVHRLYRDKNLGCREGVSSAIDWFFSHVEQGVILEDDTLPDPSFFDFAEAMLERYRGEQQVMHISGNNFQFGRIRRDGAYYASRLAHSWGWATWRRAWSKYNISMPDFPDTWNEIASKCGLCPEISNWWRRNLEAAKFGRCNTWDFQWHYTIMKYQGICLIPNLNLVENIGIGIDATHMQDKNIASTIHKNSLNWFGRPKDLKICQEADTFDFQFALKNQRPPIMSFQEFFQKLKFQYYANARPVVTTTSTVC